MPLNKIVVNIDIDIRDAVNRYIQKKLEELPTIWQALRSNDYSALQMFGHRMKGTAGGYGFEHLSVLGSQVEICAKTASAEQIKSILAQIEDYLLRLEIHFETQDEAE